VIRNFGLAESLQVKLEVKLFGAMPVDCEKRQRAACFVVAPGNVEIGNVVRDLRVVARRFDVELERLASSVNGGEEIGIVGRLTPRRAVGFGYDPGR
jgi:hypothetical protein